MVAATEVALAQLTTLHSQKQEYVGLVKTLDTSEVEGTTIEVEGKLDGEPIRLTLQEFDGTELKVTYKDQNSNVITEKIFSWKSDLKNNTLTVTTVSGQVVTDTITGWQTDLDNNTFTVTTTSGATVTE